MVNGIINTLYRRCLKKGITGSLLYVPKWIVSSQ